ncbi:hypothetical protein GCM10025868_44750 [Angustibacter aerolatus]|uniref:Uncharacterized protein n=1 Tax=Angustibacter aerolatus TaxID=1162965 RepID=A0ABQ6JPN4_9ACTN|nr:hypothetical protein GCM10025868_44750 [Angustibacter aerolatus]
MLGTVRSGAVGPDGASAGPGALLPMTLSKRLPAGATTVTATTRSSGGDVARLDALWVQPSVSALVQSGDGDAAALVRNGLARRTTQQVTLPGSGAVHATLQDDRGRTRQRVVLHAGRGGAVTVPVLPGGFTIARR